MGRYVQVPTSIKGMIYLVLQKMSKSIAECTIHFDRASGSHGPITDSFPATPGYELEATIEVDTGYVPVREERLSNEYSGKVYNIGGTLSGTDPKIGFDVIPMKTINVTETIKLLVLVYGKDLTGYTDLTFDWVLHELDR